MASIVTPAPGRLEVVRQFANTLDLEDGTDALSTPAQLEKWLRRWQLLEPGEQVTIPAELARAAAVRAAIRELLGAHHDQEPAPPAATGLLNDATRRARPQVVFGEEGWRLEVAAGGLDAALGRLAVIIAAAMQDGTWARLKLCTNQACKWAFYDASRAQTARWCSMQICGNRAKQRAWRHRQAGQLPPGDRA